jgi:microcystin-dependent protein
VSGSRYVSPYAIYTDANGTPLPGAQLFFYETNTVIPQATYQDEALTVPNSDPVVANSNGLFPSIFLIPEPAYAVYLYDQNGVLQWTADPVGPSTSAGVPSFLVGVPLPFVGEVLPAGAVELYGQAVSRVDNPLTFAALGTVWGPGDGSTTFNLPDFRGRSFFGVDNMGGTPADRLTSASLGVSATLGVTGGNELPQAHAHSVTDPGHQHTFGASTVAGSGSAEYAIVAGTNELTGISVTGLTVNTQFSGDSQNVPPAAVGYWIMYLA